jgi:hypothetical protein
MQYVITLEDGTRLPTSPGSRLAVTIQNNDILKPESIQTAYSTTSTLPDSQEVKAAVEFAHLGTSPTGKPYQQLKASLETQGVELLPRGQLQLQGYAPGQGFEFQIFGGSKDFYSTLGDKKLSELTLGGSHTWDLGNVATGLARAADAWQQLWCYDVLDRGRNIPAKAGPGLSAEPWNIYTGELYPTVYARAVWEQIFTEAGYKWAGSLPETFNRLTLPAPVGYGYSDKTIKANSVVLGWKHTNTTVYGDESGAGYIRYNDVTSLDFTVPLNYPGPQDPFFAGSNVTLLPGHKVRLNKLGLYDLKGMLRVETYSLTGRYHIKLHILGQIGGVGPVVEFCQDETNPPSGNETTQLSCFPLDMVLLPPGTILWLQFEANQETTVLLDDTLTLGAHSFFEPGSLVIVEAQENASLEVTLQKEFPAGGLVELQDWLPDMTCKDFIKQIVLKFQLTQRPHPYLNLIEFYPTSPTVVSSLGTAPTWDGKVDFSKPRQVRYQLGEFAQTNYLRWKEDQTNWAPNDEEGKVAELLGRGSIGCPDQNLALKKDLFTMEFAATPTGQEGLPFIPKWKAKAGF